jgi:Cu/Ag efflux pump CusA
MIHNIVQFALRQRFLILMLAVFLIIAGSISFQRMPVSANGAGNHPMAGARRRRS